MFVWVSTSKKGVRNQNLARLQGAEAAAGSAGDALTCLRKRPGHSYKSVEVPIMKLEAR